MRNGSRELLAELKHRVAMYGSKLDDSTDIDLVFSKKSWRMMLTYIDNLRSDLMNARIALEQEDVTPHCGSSRFAASADAIATVTLRSKHDTEVVGTPYIFEVTKSRHMQGISRHSFENIETMFSFLKGFLTTEKGKQ